MLLILVRPRLENRPDQLLGGGSPETSLYKHKVQWVRFSTCIQQSHNDSSGGAVDQLPGSLVWELKVGRIKMSSGGAMHPWSKYPLYLDTSDSV